MTCFSRTRLIIATTALLSIALTSKIGHTQQTIDNTTALFETPKIHQENSAHFGEFGTGISIKDRAESAKSQGKKSIIVSEAPPSESLDGGMGGAATKGSYLETRVANADAIVIGRSIAAHSYITKEGDFVFSEYKINIDKVLKDPSGQLHPGDAIIVAKAGGTIRIDGIIVYAVDTDFPELRTDSSYVLFLHKIPNSTAFKVTGYDTFEVRDNSVTASHKGLKSGAKSKADFMDDLQDAIQHTATKH